VSKADGTVVCEVFEDLPGSVEAGWVESLPRGVSQQYHAPVLLLQDGHGVVGTCGVVRHHVQAYTWGWLGQVRVCCGPKQSILSRSRVSFSYHARSEGGWLCFWL